jgi:hypothetical protein
MFTAAVNKITAQLLSEIARYDIRTDMTEIVIENLELHPDLLPPSAPITMRAACVRRVTISLGLRKNTKVLVEDALVVLAPRGASSHSESAVAEVRQEAWQAKRHAVDRLWEKHITHEVPSGASSDGGSGGGGGGLTALGDGKLGTMLKNAVLNAEVELRGFVLRLEGGEQAPSSSGAGSGSSNRPGYTFGLTVPRLLLRGCDDPFLAVGAQPCAPGASAPSVPPRAAKAADLEVLKLVTMEGASMYCDDEARSWWALPPQEERLTRNQHELPETAAEARARASRLRAIFTRVLNLERRAGALPPGGGSDGGASSKATVGGSSSSSSSSSSSNSDGVATTLLPASLPWWEQVGTPGASPGRKFILAPLSRSYARVRVGLSALTKLGSSSSSSRNGGGGGDDDQDGSGDSPLLGIELVTAVSTHLAVDDEQLEAAVELAAAVAAHIEWCRAAKARRQEQKRRASQEAEQGAGATEAAFAAFGRQAPSTPTRLGADGDDDGPPPTPQQEYASLVRKVGAASSGGGGDGSAARERMRELEQQLPSSDIVAGLRARFVEGESGSNGSGRGGGSSFSPLLPSHLGAAVAGTPALARAQPLLSLGVRVLGSGLAGGAGQLTVSLLHASLRRELLRFCTSSLAASGTLWGRRHAVTAALSKGWVWAALESEWELREGSGGMGGSSIFTHWAMLAAVGSCDLVDRLSPHLPGPHLISIRPSAAEFARVDTHTAAAAAGRLSCDECDVRAVRMFWEQPPPGIRASMRDGSHGGGGADSTSMCLNAKLCVGQFDLCVGAKQLDDLAGGVSSLLLSSRHLAVVARLRAVRQRCAAFRAQAADGGAGIGGGSSIFSDEIEAFGRLVLDIDIKAAHFCLVGVAGCEAYDVTLTARGLGTGSADSGDAGGLGSPGGSGGEGTVELVLGSVSCWEERNSEEEDAASAYTGRSSRGSPARVRRTSKLPGEPGGAPLCAPPLEAFHHGGQQKRRTGRYIFLDTCDAIAANHKSRRHPTGARSNAPPSQQQQQQRSQFRVVCHRRPPLPPHRALGAVRPPSQASLDNPPDEVEMETTICDLMVKPDVMKRAGAGVMEALLPAIASLPVTPWLWPAVVGGGGTLKGPRAVAKQLSRLLALDSIMRHMHPSSQASRGAVVPREAVLVAVNAKLVRVGIWTHVDTGLRPPEPPSEPPHAASVDDIRVTVGADVGGGEDEDEAKESSAGSRVADSLNVTQQATRNPDAAAGNEPPLLALLTDGFFTYHGRNGETEKAEESILLTVGPAELLVSGVCEGGGMPAFDGAAAAEGSQAVFHATTKRRVCRGAARDNVIGGAGGAGWRLSVSADSIDHAEHGSIASSACAEDANSLAAGGGAAVTPYHVRGAVLQAALQQCADELLNAWQQFGRAGAVADGVHTLPLSHLMASALPAAARALVGTGKLARTQLLTGRAPSTLWWRAVNLASKGTQQQQQQREEYGGEKEEEEQEQEQQQL